MASRSESTVGKYVLTIRCPRPHNRASDDFHVHPDKLAKMAVRWFGSNVELEIAEQAVRLRATGTGSVGDIAWWHKQLAVVLDCLRHDVELVPGVVDRYRLPRPIETEIRET